MKQQTLTRLQLIVLHNSFDCGTWRSHINDILRTNILLLDDDHIVIEQRYIEIVNRDANPAQKAAIIHLGLNLSTPKSEGEKFILDLLQNCTLRFEANKDSIFLDSQGTTLFEANFKNNYFWIKYSSVWEVLDQKYLYKDQEIRDLFKTILENHFKWKGLAPKLLSDTKCRLLENHFKWKGLTV